MIFGLTDKQKKIRKNTWKPVYVWFPVKLLDGRWAWRERVETISYWADEIHPIANHQFQKCYRMPQP